SPPPRAYPTFSIGDQAEEDEGEGGTEGGKEGGTEENPVAVLGPASYPPSTGPKQEGGRERGGGEGEKGGERMVADTWRGDDGEYVMEKAPWRADDGARVTEKAPWPGDDGEHVMEKDPKPGQAPGEGGEEDALLLALQAVTLEKGEGGSGGGEGGGGGREGIDGSGRRGEVKEVRGEQGGEGGPGSASLSPPVHIAMRMNLAEDDDLMGLEEELGLNSSPTPGAKHLLAPITSRQRGDHSHGKSGDHADVLAELEALDDGLEEFEGYLKSLEQKP
ncbi:hypothetical protein Naga_101602g2, partial [Nannochloropsis gaditana]